MKKGGKNAYEIHSSPTSLLLNKKNKIFFCKIMSLLQAFTFINKSVCKEARAWSNNKERRNEKILYAFLSITRFIA
jgi:hypothetical protein